MIRPLALLHADPDGDGSFHWEGASAGRTFRRLAAAAAVGVPAEGG
jgi:hypothetical protein